MLGQHEYGSLFYRSLSLIVEFMLLAYSDTDREETEHTGDCTLGAQGPEREACQFPKEILSKQGLAEQHASAYDKGEYSEQSGKAHMALLLIATREQKADRIFCS